MYQVYMKELREIIEEEDQQKVKKKYNRDLEDYKSQNVFKWRGNFRDIDTGTVTTGDSNRPDRVIPLVRILTNIHMDQDQVILL